MMPCQDNAVALTTIVTAPIASNGPMRRKRANQPNADSHAEGQPAQD
jgi:hypothetical protein